MRFCGLVLCLSIGGFLVGIQTTQAAPQAGDAWLKMVKQQYGGMTITCAFVPHPTTDAYQKMEKEFTDATGIKVRWDVIEESYLREKLLLEHQSKTGVYDVLLIDAFNMAQYSPSGVAIDLGPFLKDPKLTPAWFDYADILPAYSEGIGAFNGVTYGIPVAGETRYIGYRKDLFTKYGKQPPKTMDEFLSLAKFFNGKEPGLFGVAMRGQKGVHFASGWMTTMYQNGGQFLDQKTWKVLFNSPGTVSSLQYYVDLLKQGPPDIGTYTHEEAVTAFMSGKVAMWFDATSLTPWILDPSKSKVYNKVGFVPPPAGLAGAYGALAGWSVGISSDIPDNRKGAAWAFIVWMTSKSNALEYVKLGGAPVRKSVYTNPALVAADWTFPIQLASLDLAANLVRHGITWIPPNPKTMKILEVAGDYGSSVLAGEMSPQEAMDKAQPEAVAIMNE
jgi:multiple sugar transport system substrate-binding protein